MKPSTTSFRSLELVGRKACPDDLTPVDGLASGPSPARLAEALRCRHCPPDRVFDRHLPSDLRVASREFWTPLEIALRAAEWLDEFGIRSVVDIGSGVGKFCIAAALASRCVFTGLEHRPRLVAVADELARRFECSDRVRFVEARFGATATPDADAYYLFNPFEENTYEPEAWLDRDVELSKPRYFEALVAMQDLLHRAPVGTYLLTYNGFGGAVPPPYRLLRVDQELRNTLCLWRKMAPHRPTPTNGGA